MDSTRLTQMRERGRAVFEDLLATIEARAESCRPHLPIPAVNPVCKTQEDLEISLLTESCWIRQGYRHLTTWEIFLKDFETSVAPHQDQDVLFKARLHIYVTKSYPSTTAWDRIIPGITEQQKRSVRLMQANACRQYMEAVREIVERLITRTGGRFP